MFTAKAYESNFIIVLTIFFWNKFHYQTLSNPDYVCFYVLWSNNLPMTFSIGDQDHVLTPLSVLRWKKNGHQEPYFTRQISSQKLKIIIIIHKKENYITWVIQYKKKENMVYMKANIDVCCSLTFALSLSRTIQDNFTMPKRTVMVDILISLQREWTTKWTTMEAITRRRRKKGNPHMIINTMFYHTRLMKESKKDRKSVV